MIPLLAMFQNGNNCRFSHVLLKTFGFDVQ
jgi:hypothetical protein